MTALSFSKLLWNVLQFKLYIYTGIYARAVDKRVKLETAYMT